MNDRREELKMKENTTPKPRNEPRSPEEGGHRRMPRLEGIGDPIEEGSGGGTPVSEDTLGEGES